MGLLDRLFPCRGCRAKDEEIARLEKHLDWTQRQIDLQNKRLVEIAEPHTNGRIALSERGPRPRVAHLPQPMGIPGLESPPDVEIELDEGGS